MTAPSPDQKFELLHSDDYKRYLLEERREIAFVLKQMAAQRAVVSAFYGNKGQFLSSSVSAVNESTNSVWMDLGIDEEAIAEALASDALVCVTQLDKIKIQFRLEHPVRTEFEGFPALVARLPTKLLRLQRREYYRLTTPLSDALICEIPMGPEGAVKKVEARVLDISGGGIAVLVPPNAEGFVPQTLYRKCRLALPEYGIVEASLRVCNVFRITNAAGGEVLRAGCQFFDLSTPMANAIQRYILKVERERRSMGLYT